MGWHDDGVAMGMWGQDGIPYGINSRSWSDDDSDYERKYSSNKARNKRSSKRYNSSEQRAYDLGYKAVYDNNAFNGRYFQKNGKIWIHNIEALRSKLDADDSDLEDLGYDVDAYYRYK